MRAWSENPATGLSPEMTTDECRLLRELIYRHSGLSFSADLAYLLRSRLGPRLSHLGLADFRAYYRYLRYDPDRAAEVETAIEVLTTNETYLYREPQQLQSFSEELLPDLARQNAGRRKLRIWSAGCSTGEEVYTVAALVARSGLFVGWDVEVFGSDIVPRVIEVARAGTYGPRAFRTPEAEALRPWFVCAGERWRAGDRLRAVVRFGCHNLLDGRPADLIGAADVVFCRNVLIYFDLAARRQAMRTFAGKLRGGGYLLLGHAESLLNATSEFEPVHLLHDLVYRKPPPPS